MAKDLSRNDQTTASKAVTAPVDAGLSVVETSGRRRDRHIQCTGPISTAAAGTESRERKLGFVLPQSASAKPIANFSAAVVNNFGHGPSLLRSSFRDALAALRRDPMPPVRVHVEDMDVELRALRTPRTRDSARDDTLASLAMGRREYQEQLLELLREDLRKAGFEGL